LEYTLEPQIVAANNLTNLNTVLGKQYRSEAEAIEGMLSDKTGAALAIFTAKQRLLMPKYIRDVFDN
jgi:hypothetical protein